MSKTKSQILSELVEEGMADDTDEAEMMLKDMGITWQDVRDGRWH